MKILHRLGYYLGGFSVGLIFLAFIFNGKKTSCNYSHSARVKNDLLQKTIQIDSALLQRNPQITVEMVKEWINSGDINFSKSDTERDSCRLYHIEHSDNKNQYLRVENCAKTIQLVEVKMP